MGELTLNKKATAWNKKSSFTKEEENLLNRERREFLNKFSKTRISSLTLKDYAIQTGLSHMFYLITNIIRRFEMKFLWFGQILKHFSKKY